jgi:3-(3-hydroxy-phenyl)propionate hydroxylase
VVTTVEVPVAVVGAGPVGMTAALAFARQGVPVTVLEADEPGVRAEWRGSTLHPPTLELLDRIDILESVVAGCVRVDRVQYRDLESDAVATFDYAALAGHTAVPFRAQFEQYKLLRLLRTAVTETPDIDVRHASRVMDSREDGEHLTLTVVPGDGVPYEVRARWVIAADGAHSTMRKLAGIDFPGTTYPTMSLVAATRFPFEEAVADLAPVTYVSGPQGRLSLIRTPDTWRIAVSTDVDSGGATPDAWRAEEPHPSLREALDLLVGGRAWAAEPLEQHQFYRSHQRVAGAFRAGRVLLVGDAAHLTSTTGGMGLNSGVHDAFDLAARLAPPVVAQDAGGEDRAATAYARERRQVAVDVVQPDTRAARAGVDARNRDVRLGRLAQLQRDAADPAARLRHLRQASMLSEDRSGQPETAPPPADAARL